MPGRLCVGHIDAEAARRDAKVGLGRGSGHQYGRQSSTYTDQ